MFLKRLNATHTVVLLRQLYVKWLWWLMLANSRQILPCHWVKFKLYLRCCYTMLYHYLIIVTAIVTAEGADGAAFLMQGTTKLYVKCTFPSIHLSLLLVLCLIFGWHRSHITWFCPIMDVKVNISLRKSSLLATALPPNDKLDNK